MAIFQRMWDVLGLNVDDEELEYDDEDMQEDDAQEQAWQEQQEQQQQQQRRRNAPSNASGNVVGMPNRGGVQPEMMVMEPRSFDEMPQVVAALKQRKSVILNLSLMDADSAQRCVDFVSGGTFALDGHQHRIGETIFLFTPGFVQISSYAPSAPPIPSSYMPPVPQQQSRRSASPVPAWAIDDINMAQ